MNVPSKRFLFAGAFVFGLWAAVQAADVFTLVTERSQIEFVGSKPGKSHRGGFKRFTVDATADWADLAKGSFRLEIDATSLGSCFDVIAKRGGLAAHRPTADHRVRECHAYAATDQVSGNHGD